MQVVRRANSCIKFYGLRPILQQRLVTRHLFCTNAMKNDEKAPNEVTDSNESSSQIESIVMEKDQLSKQLKDMEDKYKRSLAEAENIRRRMNKQIEDAKVFGIQSFCKDLLDVSDILSKAIESVPTDQLKDGVNPPLKSMHEGLKMTESQLLKTFSKHGLEKICPADGDKFDPNFHEALFQMPLIEGKTPGSVAQMSKVGYKLHERTLRAAAVGVYRSE